MSQNLSKAYLTPRSVLFPATAPFLEQTAGSSAFSGSLLALFHHAVFILKLGTILR